MEGIIILKWGLIRMRIRNSFAQTETIGGFFGASRVPSVFRDSQFHSGDYEVYESSGMLRRVDW